MHSFRRLRPRRDDVIRYFAFGALRRAESGWRHLHFICPEFSSNCREQRCRDCAMLEKVRQRAAVATLALLLAGAGPPPSPPITDWSKIETVIVTATPPGPALWHVVRGDSEVWILGTVQPMPKGLKWNSSEIAALLRSE